MVAGPPVQAAKRAGTTGSWASGVTVSAAEQPDPTRGSQGNAIAANAAGVTLAAWDRFSYTGTGGGSIGAAIERGGRWSAPFTVSPETSGFAEGPRVAVGPDGTLAASWTWNSEPGGGTLAIEVAVRRPADTTWTTTRLATSTVGGTQGLALTAPLAFDAAGNLTAAWSIWTGGAHDLQAATLPAGSATWGTVAHLAPGLDAVSPQLAVNASGAAAVAFTDSSYTITSTGGTAAHVIERSGATAAWGAPVTVSEVLVNTVGYIVAPLVAIDGTGRATVAWFGYGLEASRQTATGWTPRRTIIDPGLFGESFQSVDLAIDEAGNALAMADVFDPTPGVDRASVWVARGDPQGGWTRALRLTDPTVPVDAYAARAAVSPDGGLVMVAWVDHYHGTVSSARFLPATGTWSTIPVGKGTAFSSFQETVSLVAPSASVARVAWKKASGGTLTVVADWRP